MTIKREVREVYEEACQIGQAKAREATRHRNANERLMVRAAENVYAAHLVEFVKPDGYTPRATGQEALDEIEAAVLQGKALTAKAYSMLIGFSEAYISRLYRLGFALAAGVVDPSEKQNGGATRWQLLSRAVGDSPEVAEVLGKDVTEVPTVERLDAAIDAAVERRARERLEQAEKVAAEAGWIPSAPSEQIGMLEELSTVLRHGRTLTPKQIDRVRTVLDNLSALIEDWLAEQHEPTIPRQKVSA